MDYTCGPMVRVDVRLEEHKLWLLVLIGVRADGRKELLALADGYRESAKSWADLLRDVARRGLRAPVLDVGDGALGFWGALREVFPQTREQRCWFHRTEMSSPRRPSPRTRGARRALTEIWDAEDKDHRAGPPRRSRPPMGRSSPRSSPRSPTTSTSCSSSTTTPPGTGSAVMRFVGMVVSCRPTGLRPLRARNET